MLFKKIQKKFIKKGKNIKSKKSIKILFIQTKKEKRNLNFLNSFYNIARGSIFFFKQKTKKNADLFPLFSTQQQKSFFTFIKNKGKNHKKNFFIFFTAQNIKKD